MRNINPKLIPFLCAHLSRFFPRGKSKQTLPFSRAPRAPSLIDCEKTLDAGEFREGRVLLAGRHKTRHENKKRRHENRLLAVCNKEKQLGVLQIGRWNGENTKHNIRKNISKRINKDEKVHYRRLDGSTVTMQWHENYAYNLVYRILVFLSTISCQLIQFILMIQFAFHQ